MNEGGRGRGIVSPKCGNVVTQIAPCSRHLARLWSKTASFVEFENPDLHQNDGGRIIDNLQIDNLQIDNRQIDNLQIDNLTNFRQIDNRQIDNLSFYLLLSLSWVRRGAK